MSSIRRGSASSVQARKIFDGTAALLPHFYKRMGQNRCCLHCIWEQRHCIGMYIQKHSAPNHSNVEHAHCRSSETSSARLFEQG